MSSFFSMDSPFFSFMSRLADIVLLNLLYIICCLPVFTIGAATSALYYQVMKMSKNEESYVFRGFFKAFRENFKKDAQFQLRSRAVLEKVVEVENITITDEELTAEIEKLAARYNMDAEELKKSFGGYEKEMLSSDLRVQKAAEIITSTANVVTK